MIIERYTVRSKEPVVSGKHTIVVDTTLPNPGVALTVVMSVDGDEVAKMTTKRSASAAFLASETFDVGIDLGSPVSRAYEECRPFEFDGEIYKVKVALK